ncbi:MAG TPA: NAD(P)-dependent oxidoreductase [Chthoniobacteraceae bacterium]|nr:NAD(P)-dependent oxidoreductase [Chthoniobacteraceae bacterium]
MNIHFVDTQPSEREYFADKFPGHDVRFVHDLADVGEDAEVVSIYIRSRVDAAFLDAHPRVRMLATRSNGVDHLDMDECRRRGVVVSTVHGAESNTVAEHTFALILALARRLDEVRQANKQPHFYYDRLRSFDLKDKTLGVIGAGRIGLRTIHIALAFGMKVVANDPHHVSVMAETIGVRYVGFDELLRESHVVTIHTPLTPETHHLLDAAAFAKCRRGVIIINTARGGVVDTEALIEALDSGIVAGAGLDVLEDESVMRKEGTKIIADQIIARLHAGPVTGDGGTRDPDRLKEIESLTENARLISRPNVVFTPHVAFNSVEAIERINSMTVENIHAFLASKPLNSLTR